MHTWSGRGSHGPADAADHGPQLQTLSAAVKADADVHECWALCHVDCTSSALHAAIGSGRASGHATPLADAASKLSFAVCSLARDAESGAL